MKLERWVTATTITLNGKVTLRYPGSRTARKIVAKKVDSKSDHIMLEAVLLKN